jgi:hypothetical protein
MLQHMATISLASLVQEQDRPGREDRAAAGAPGHRSGAGGQARARAGAELGVCLRAVVRGSRLNRLLEALSPSAVDGSGRLALSAGPRPAPSGERGRPPGAGRRWRRSRCAALAFEVAAADFAAVLGPAGKVGGMQRQRLADAAQRELAAHLGQALALEAKACGDEEGSGCSVLASRSAWRKRALNTAMPVSTLAVGMRRLTSPRPAARSSSTAPRTGPKRPRVVEVPKC